MAVPVVLGASSFDFRGLRAEQSRLSKLLVKASPRDVNDTSAILEVNDSQVPPSKYPAYIKAVPRDDGTGANDFLLYMKDNFDQEFQIGTTTTTFPTPPLVGAPGQGGGGNAPGSTIAINGTAPGPAPPAIVIPSDFMIDSRTGEIFQGREYDGAGVLQIAGTQVGLVKFDGATGLELATINDRIADVSNAVEGMTKILGVVSGNLDTAVNLIR